MNKFLSAITAAAILFAACDSSNKQKHFGGPESIGSEEDAHERLTYEWTMLHDPATGKIPAHIREKELAFAATLPSDKYLSLAKTTVASWQKRGPWNVGGRTRAFAIDISNENNLVAGSCSGGMWRSTDAGLSWTPTSLMTQHQSVSCLAQDVRAGHTSTWYYGTGEAYGASASTTGAYYLGNGIYKSTDGGVSWNVLPSTTTTNLTGFDFWGDLVWNIVTDASNTAQDVVYAASYDGIYKSADGGGTWTLKKGGGGTPSYFTDVAISATGVVYATLSSDGSQKGIYRSADGITFTDITPANFPAVYDRVKIGISPADENQVYFLGHTPGFGQPDTSYTGEVEWNSLWKYNYLSGDGSGAGGLWRDLSVNLPTTGGPFDKYKSQGSYDIVVKIKPDDTNTVFIGGTNIYRSTSGFKDDANTAFIGGYEQGASLPIVNGYLNHHPDQHELAFLPSDPTKMISANDGGIFRTNDNMAGTVAWTPLNNGYLTTMFYTCAIDHATTSDIIIAGAQDNGSWYTNSATLTTPWVSPRGGDGSWCAIADNESAYYFSIQNGKMMRAKLDASGGIDSFARIDPRDGKGYLFINPYTLDPNNNNLMYLAAGSTLWRNNDLSGIPYASNWDSITTNWVKFPDTVAGGTKISAVAVSKNPANRVYYGTTNRRVYRIDNANTGTPAKVEITGASIAGFFPTANVSCIAVDPNNGDHLIVVFSNYGVQSLFYSEDGGTNWKKCGGNIENTNGPSCRWASIIPVNGGNVYLLGTSVGLFAAQELKADSTKWVLQGANEIGNAVIDQIDYRTTDGLVVIATHSHGIYSTHITDINDVLGIKDIVNAQPGFSLTNYPNPFSDQTIIQFNLKQKASVSLKVYDEMGRLVRTVAEEMMSAGEKKYPFAANGLSPGIYYCTLRAGSYSETRRIVVTSI